MNSTFSGGEFDRTPTFVVALTALALVAIGLTVAPGIVVADEADSAPDPDDYDDILDSMPGDGSVDDPYVVTTVTELQAVAGDLGANYVLGDDVDATATATWNDGAGFEPIGDGDDVFTGTFDGDGHAIVGLTIDRSEEDYVGLFGANEGTIERVGLESASITGKLHVGTLAGDHAGGEIGESYATGTVAGLGNVGGLVGFVTGGTVDASYATSDVDGEDGVGGLVGWMSGGEVSESYAIGAVTSDGTVGGLVGWVDGGSVTDSYWNRETTGQDVSGGSHESYGLTTFEMLGAEATENMDLSFGSTWAVVSEDGAVSYPYLSENSQQPAPGYEERFADGDGTEDAPYEIETWHHLENVRLDLDANYTLAADLDEETDGYDEVASAGANDGAGFDPIGDAEDGFTGTFDGNGHAIVALTIDRNDDEIGLFGVNEGSLERIGLESATVDGETRVGGLVGANHGTVERSHANDTTSSATRVGGLVGSNTGVVKQSSATGAVTGNFGGGLVGVNDGTVTQSYATGTVTSTMYGGGLVGQNSGEVTQSYATGPVTGSDQIGGLIGMDDDGTVEHSYATGPVTGEFLVGGLVGRTDGSQISSSYWDRRTTGQPSSDGSPDEAGLTTGEMTGMEATNNMNFSFIEAWDIVDEDNVVSYPYLRENPQEPAPGLQERFAGGRGTAAAPYEIETWHHLDNVRLYLDADYVLIADLDEETDGYDEVASASANDGAGFDPIGIDSDPFSGTFDGDGHTIANLTADRGSDTGLVGVNEGTLRNVTLTDANVTGLDRVGGLAGINEGSIEDSSSDGTFTATQFVGSLVGVNEDEGEIVDATGSGTVEGVTHPAYYNASAGGLVGSNHGYIEASSADATVTADEHVAVGGLAGWNWEGTINESAASGVVVGENRVGGLVGHNWYGGEITEAYATATVYGEIDVGGLVGVNDDSIVSDAYTTGDVYGSDRTGGFVGTHFYGIIDAAYTTGDVSGNDRTGGFAGEYEGDSITSITDGYWDGEVATDPSLVGVGSGDDDGVTELDTDQLTGHDAANHLDGFDFVPRSTWATIHDDYPTLSWQVDIIDVASLDPEETTVDAGESVPVTVTVDNPEPVDMTGTIELRLEDDLVSTIEVELELAGDETITFDGEDAIDTYGLEGEYTYTVATDTDQASGTLTVGPGPDEPQLGTYTNDDDIVDTDGLRDAIDDWRSGVIDTDLLRDVIDAWRSGDPVD